VSGFYYVFSVPIDTDFIFRQSYFLPFIFIATPVFTRSFNFGLFNLLLKRNILFILLAFYLFPYSILFSTILLYSIKNHKVAFAIFLLISIQMFITGNNPGQIVLSQLIIITFFIFKINLNFKYISIFIISLIFITYFINYELAFLLASIDSNWGWRLFIWIDNIKSTINDTFLLGHGFGTSYFAGYGRNPGDFIPLIGAEATIRQYPSPYIAEFVLAQHNSFVNMFYRLGIIGLLLFLGVFKTLGKQIDNINAPHQLKYIVLISMLIISVNVGLESPGFATQFAFIIGLTQHYIISCRKNYI